MDSRGRVSRFSGASAGRRLRLVALFAALAGCAGKQTEQIRVRYIPESRHSVFIGLPANNTTLTELPRLLQDGLSSHYQNSRELTLTRDFASADLYLELEITEWLETPTVDLKGGSQSSARYLLKCLVSFRDIKTKDYFIKEKPVDLSVIGPLRRQFDPLPESVSRALLTRLAFSLDCLVVSGTAPVIGLYGYEGLEDNLNQSWFERQNLSTFDRSVRDYRDRPESDFVSLSNQAESNRQRAILERDRRGLH